MFHLRRSCIFIITIVVLVVVVILLQTHSLRVDVIPPVAQLSHDILSRNQAEITESYVDKIKLSKKRKVPSQFVRENNTEFLYIQSTPETVNRIRETKVQSLDIKLLEDNELRDGEISDTGDVSPDIIIKYDNGMFGLIDSDPTLHVWRASFTTIGEIWPHPRSVATTKNVFTLCSRSGSLSFRLTGADNYIIQHAIKRYKKVLCDKKVSVYPSNWRQQEYLLDSALFGQHIFLNKPKDYDHSFDSLNSFSASLKGEVRSVNIFMESNGHDWPSLYMNESYRLTVNIRGISIRAKETWGVIRALESVSQLAWRTRSGRVFINETKITDQPRFKHRGVMLDCARHFMSKHVILKNFDAMEMNKMNVFHWHISDDQSFPLITENHPEFAKYGAYDPETKVYRPDDVKEILEYARLRGIRVIPEIDSPSHSLSWRKSHPEVMTRCIDINGRWSGHYGPLNMAGANTYRLLRSLFTDIVHMFPDQWIHLGSDEVPTSCLLNNQAVQKWMQAKGMFSVDFLTDFYMRKLQNIVTEIGLRDSRLQRGFIVWQEAYERNAVLKKGTIVQLWKSQSTSEAVALARQRISVIYSSCWYLDRLEYGAQWVTHYQCDPGEDFGSMLMMNDYSSTQSNEDWKEYILGGEAAMWTEFFDSDNVLPRMWPLASAAAERLWSPSSVNNAEKAAPRLEEMRCRLMIRSVPTGVASGAGDCGQSMEDSTDHNHDHQYRPLLGAIIHISDTSSFSLIGQLLINLLDRPILLLLLTVIIVVLLCIYVPRHPRHSSRRLALVLMLALLATYILVSIFSQHTSLH